jgi:hypothetical protein
VAPVFMPISIEAQTKMVTFPLSVCHSDIRWSRRALSLDVPGGWSQASVKCDVLIISSN